MTDSPSEPEDNQASLSDEHLDFLTKAAITPDVVRSAGIYSVTKREQLPDEFKEWPGRKGVPGIVFPWRGFSGDVVPQLRPDTKVVRKDGHEVKYVFPADVEMVLNVHPMMDALVRDAAVPLIIVEGTKQTLAAVSAVVGARDFAVVGMPGCYGWSQHRRQIPDLKALASVLRGRDVILSFDADWKTNRDVWEAAEGLTGLLKLHGAASIRYTSVPGGGTRGLDDALADTVDPVSSMRGILAAATDKLGRRPAKSKRTAAYFDEDGSLLTAKAVDALLAEQPVALAADGTLAVYRDGHFMLDPQQNSVLAVVGQLLGDKYRPQYRAAIVEFLKGQLDAERTYIPSEPRSRLLNLRNGMLNLDTLKLRPHDPKYLSTTQLPVDWDPEAEAPTYDAWIEACAGDQVELVEEIAALMLDPAVTPTKTLFLYGPSRSGKSTFLRLMRAIAGEEHTSNVTLHALANDNFAAADLYSKILNVAADLSSAHVADLSTWKMLTGEDAIAANRKYGSRFNFVNRALFAYSANEPPGVGENSRAYYERMVPVRFGASFAGKEDPTLERRMLAEELPGILRRWVEARQARLARGRFKSASAVVRDEFQTFSDRVARWVSEEKSILREAEGKDGIAREVTEGMYLKKSADATKGTDLHREFQQWAKDDGSSGLGRTKFLQRLTRLDGVFKVRIGKGDRAFNVIDRPDEDDPPDPPTTPLQADRQSSTTTSNKGVREEGGDKARLTTNPTHNTYTRKSFDASALPSRDDRVRECEEFLGITGRVTEEVVESDDGTQLPVLVADVDDLTLRIYEAIAVEPAQATETKIRDALKISSTEYHAARDHLITLGAVARRKGRGFDLLAILRHEPRPYTPMVDPDLTNHRGERLFKIRPKRVCGECGEPDDGRSHYFPLCTEHRYSGVEDA